MDGGSLLLGVVDALLRCVTVSPPDNVEHVVARGLHAIASAAALLLQGPLLHRL